MSSYLFNYARPPAHNNKKKPRHPCLQSVPKIKSEGMSPMPYADSHTGSRVCLGMAYHWHYTPHIVNLFFYHCPLRSLIQKYQRYMMKNHGISCWHIP